MTDLTPWPLSACGEGGLRAVAALESRGVRFRMSDLTPRPLSARGEGVSELLPRSNHVG